MFSSPHVLTVCVALLSLSMFAHGQLEKERDCSSDCNLYYRCDPSFYDPVWTIVDGQCEVFNNNCMFSNENCNRRKKCLPEMTAITREECQPHCHHCQCEPKSAPVCGWYLKQEANGTRTTEYRTFNSRCDMKQKSCDEAKAYMFSSDGVCP